MVIYCGALVVAVYLAVVSFSNIKAERLLQYNLQQQKPPEKWLETQWWRICLPNMYKAPDSIQDFLGGRGLYKPDRQTDFFNRIQSEVKYKKWYFGHYHMDYNVSHSEVLLNKKIIPLGGMLKEER